MSRQLNVCRDLFFSSSLLTQRLILKADDRPFIVLTETKPKSKVRAAAHMRVYARTRANIEVPRREIDRYINTSLQKTLVFKTPVFLLITPSHGLFPAFSTPCTPCPFRHGMPARNQRLYFAFAEQTSQTPLTLLRLLSPAHSLTDALPSYVPSLPM